VAHWEVLPSSVWPRLARRFNAGIAAKIESRSAGSRSSSRALRRLARSSRRSLSNCRPTSVISTRTTRASCGSLPRIAYPSRSRRLTNCVIAGCVTLCAAASSESRVGPPASSARSVDAVVSEMSGVLASLRIMATTRSKLATSAETSALGFTALSVITQVYHVLIFLCYVISVIKPSAETRPSREWDGPGLVAVALDGSATSWRAFSWALGHARRSRCPILAIYIGARGRMLSALAYAYPLSATISVDEAVRRSEAIVADEARDQAERFGAEFGVAVIFEATPGASLRDTFRRAERAGADVLVVGASRKTARGVPRQRMPVVVIP
jgi:nucleotide-binding universal stress UspA family protein